MVNNGEQTVIFSIVIMMDSIELDFYLIHQITAIDISKLVHCLKCTAVSTTHMA